MGAGRTIGRILSLRKSMFVQMALLTALFLGWGIYTFVLQSVPALVSREDLADAPPNTSVRDAIYAFMLAQRENPRTAPDIADDPAIRAARAANPGFRYHIRVDDRAFGDGQARYYHRLGFDRLEALHRALPPYVCSQGSNEIDGVPGSYADISICEHRTYFEYDGLKRAGVAPPPDMWVAYRKWLWVFGGNFLTAAGGMFLIFALIMLANMIQIRRVARLAQSFDPEHLDRKLPETGLASEILPLVRAVNAMIARVEESQRRNAFFLSAAAHEMRTPLTVLRTRLELMDEDALKDQLVADVRRIIELVNQLLALMTIGSRREVAGLTDLVVCVHRVVDDLAPLAAQRGVTIRFEPALGICEIAGDAALIRSAVGNLVGNAVSFSPAGGAVEVGVAAPARVTVRDHGPGLGDASPATLFEPFVRAPASRPGFGLGLAIAKAVATLHGGAAGAANAPGGGAIFTLDFDAGA